MAIRTLNLLPIYVIQMADRYEKENIEQNATVFHLKNAEQLFKT
jgi:hypothetical protein